MKRVGAISRIALAALLSAGILFGCGKERAVSGQNEVAAVISSAESAKEIAGHSTASAEEAIDAGSTEVSEEASAINSSNPYEKTDEVSVEASSEATSESSSETSEATVSDYLLPEDGIYDSKEEVALYIHTYDKLPSNYITKKEARALGWPGGDLSEYAPGKCIGGDRFGNNEGLLPDVDGRNYKECDIDTLGKKKRGAKRIIYSNDGYIYYTEDHYASFELLYEGD